MWVAIVVEFQKVFSKLRTFIGFIALALLIPVVVLAMGAEGMKYFEFATQSLEGAFSITGNLMNGYTIAYIILGSLYIHVPFLVTLVAGDSLAGEATAGTYRLLITRPISRVQLVLSKYIVATSYTVLIVAWLALLSVGLGVALLGTGEAVVIRSQITILAQHDVLWRLGCAYAFAALAMTTVSSIAFLCSSLVENAIGPIMTTMAIIIVFTIVGAIDLPFFATLRIGFFTTHMSTWKHFFDNPVPWEKIVTSVTVLLSHIAICLAATFIVMQRKDILS
jgi:ABC-2 type transport system permease protein